MTNERESEGGKREASAPITLAVVLLLLIPCLYVGATGPLNLLIERGYMSEGAMTVVQYVYAPLAYLIRNSKTVDNLFDIWFSLWQ